MSPSVPSTGSEIGMWVDAEHFTMVEDLFPRIVYNVLVTLRLSLSLQRVFPTSLVFCSSIVLGYYVLCIYYILCTIFIL